jgi:hypothetical protein
VIECRSQAARGRRCFYVARQNGRRSTNYNFDMGRFVIEHLPRKSARYRVIPLTHVEAKAWIQASSCDSLVRTTELIAAVSAGMGITLDQTDTSVALGPGDEAVLISLSYGVLLAWAQGNIPPLAEDWRCSLLTVEDPAGSLFSSLAEVADDLSAQNRPSETVLTPESS